MGLSETHFCLLLSAGLHVSVHKSQRDGELENDPFQGSFTLHSDSAWEPDKLASQSQT